MHRRFVVVSGLPASGKTTLAQQLATRLRLPLLDKDAILEQLFDLRGAGDHTWRRTLSNESDLILKSKAIASNGAVLVSHWQLPGMSPDSGTATEWLAQLSDRIVHVQCICPAEIAATRFVQRQRHTGHLDSAKTHFEVLASIQAVASLGALNIDPRVDVDTSLPPAIEDVVRDVHGAFSALRQVTS